MHAPRGLAAAGMNCWADGLNFYLATHPNVKPRVITRFEPWMALSFSEGSIGGDIESGRPARLEALYGKNPAAIGPRRTAIRPQGGSTGAARLERLRRRAGGTRTARRCC